MLKLQRRFIIALFKLWQFGDKSRGLLILICLLLLELDCVSSVLFWYCVVEMRGKDLKIKIFSFVRMQMIFLDLENMIWRMLKVCLNLKEEKLFRILETPVKGSQIIIWKISRNKPNNFLNSNKARKRKNSIKVLYLSLGFRRIRSMWRMRKTKILENMISHNQT